MVEGLWTVQFTSTLGMFGSGVLVIAPGNRLLGGDGGYYYTGKYELKNRNIKGEVDVIRYQPTHVSVFGNLGSFHLKFEGKLSDDEFAAEGLVAGQPNLKLNVNSRKKVDIS